MTAVRYRALRLRLGTQAEAARLLGLSRITITRRESDALPITREADLAITALARRSPRKPRSVPA